MSTEQPRLTEAAWAVIQAASEPIRFPSSAGSDALVLVPASYLEFLRSALEPDDCTQIAPPIGHEYDGACNSFCPDCVCMYLVDGQWCGKDRDDPIHGAPGEDG